MDWFAYFLLIILALYLFAHLFFRYILPWLIKRFVKKMAKKMNIVYEDTQKQYSKKQGEINIDYIPPQKEEESVSEKGDYVDYEEIK